MELLLVKIQISLTNIASDLFAGGIGQATLRVNDAFEELAYQFADDAELLFGVPPHADPACQYPNSAKRILVCRGGNGPCLYPTRDTQGGFLFDNCWLIYNSSKAADYAGRLAGCALVMESEWQFDNLDEFNFLQDFRKLLIANARVKVFIFRSQNTNEQEETFLKLLREIKSYGTSGYAVGTYLLCGWHLNAFHYVTVCG